MSAPPQSSVRPAARQELASPATQIVGDRETYLGQGAREVGRRISETQFELFVVGDASAALQQQFESAVPDFIALHDLGGTASDETLSSLTRRLGVRRQVLAIRREGQGVPLAELPFVEVQAADGKSLRVYGGSINGDTRTRHQIAQLLLAHSRLGVVLVPDTPRHALAAAVKPVRDAIARGPWPNGDLLLAPLALLPGLPAEAATLAGRSGVTVRLLPTLARVGDLWQHVADTWNAMQSRTGGLTRLTGAAPPVTEAPEPGDVPSWEAPTMPMDLRAPPTPSAPFAISAQFAPLTPAAPAPPVAVSSPAARPGAPLFTALNPTPTGGAAPATPSAAGLPAMPSASPMPVPGRTDWADYARRCAALRGVISSCVFDQPSQRLIAHAGGRPSGDRLTTQGAILAATMIEAGRALGAGIAFRDALITIGSYQLVLHAVPGHPGVMLHLVVDSRQGSAAMARAQVEKLDP
jgi:hypothetical protein